MTSTGRLLVVDDELVVRDSLQKWFQDEGYEVQTAANASEALQWMAEGKWDAALVDIKMPGTDGIALQRQLRRIDPELEVIVITGYASVETAVQALKNGAFDYVTKPFDPEEITHIVRNALALRRTKNENVRLRERVVESSTPPNIIGRSAAMRAVLEAIETVAPTDTTVLIAGESGTGKELVARAIHARSRRCYNPLVVLHCGALSENLLESELFGHEKGAFTGAQARKKGKFEIVEGGTIFLDEVGDISLQTQTDLLRVLQEHEITRVGGNQTIRVDFRCIAATNRNLEQLIDEGAFRLDLYYRLNVFRIDVPPLRDRREDIPLLVDHFIRKFSESMNKRITGTSAGVMETLQRHDWTGNVRELENAIERAMVVAREPELREEDFLLGTGEPSPDGRSLQEVERTHILRTLADCHGNKTLAASVLGIDRVTLYHKLKKYGWKRPHAVDS